MGVGRPVRSSQRSRCCCLGPRRAGGGTQVFVRDRQTGTTERMSVDGAGNPANGYSFNPTISADGRFVAFDSSATNLVAGDTNRVVDVFVHDRRSPDAP